MERRTFLKFSLAASVCWASSKQFPDNLGLSEAQAADLFSVRGVSAPDGVFPQSIASGDPGPSSIVLWTRIVAQSAGAVKIAFEISTTAGFVNPVLRGLVDTDTSRDWTVKTQLSDALLQPNTLHYYRFIFNGTASRTGRFKTLPLPGASVERLRFAYISCQDYTNGYYTALGFLAQEDIDFVVHLGDAIYETVNDASFQNAQVRPIVLPSGHSSAQELGDYRHLYKTYRADRNLQRVHEQFAFIHIWDDHEFANDCYQVFDTDSNDEQANFAPDRRAAASRAWAEYTPAAISYDSTAEPLQQLKIYRSFQFGNLLELVMTDERLYRDAPPCGLAESDRYLATGCTERLNPERTMLGLEQRDWFLDRIKNSECTWKIWGNEVQVMQNKVLNSYVAQLFPALPVTGDVFFALDQWDGFPAERAHILSEIRNAGVKNFVTITGDIHSFIAGYQRVNFDNPLEAPVGVCFVCGSITSSNLVEMVNFGGIHGLPVPVYANMARALTASNPHVQFFNSAVHGYNLMEVTPQSLTCTMRAVSTIRSPQATIRTLHSFRVPRDRVLIQDLGPGLLPKVLNPLLPSLY